MHGTTVALHPEVLVKVSINVARSQDEADRQSRGEDVTMIKEEKIELETFKEDDDYRSAPGTGEQPDA